MHFQPQTAATASFQKEKVEEILSLTLAVSYSFLIIDPTNKACIHFCTKRGIWHISIVGRTPFSQD